MIDLSGWKDNRTSLPAMVSAICAFVALNHDLFPQDESWGKFITRICSFLAAGGLAALGLNAASSRKVMEKQEEKTQEVISVTEEMIDQKIEASESKK